MVIYLILLHQIGHSGLDVLVLFVAPDTRCVFRGILTVFIWLLCT